LEEVMAPFDSSFDSVSPAAGKGGRGRRLRAPWRRGAWTPEEVAAALHSHREELLRELRGLSSARSLPGGVLEEIVDDAVCAVVMKPRAVLDEEHLRRAFWLSVKLMLARYREGRHRVRVGSWERADFDAVARQASVSGRTVTEEVELKDRMARAADFMAQLDEFEARVTVVMAIRGAGIRATARELDVPLKTVKAAAHSAQTKLEQVAAIAAAGRMCGYRQRAVEAHASGTARAEEVHAAQAHIAACTSCRSSYVRLVREMRRREFQRRASAAFLPLPMLAEAAHASWAERLGAFVSARLPGGGASGPRERVLGLLGGGAGAAKTAGVLAGTALIVVGATSGIHDLGGSHHSPRHARHTHVLSRSEASVRLRDPAMALPQIPASSVPARSVQRTVQTGQFSHSPDGGFVYLGGHGAASHRATAPVSASATRKAEVASFGYLGANTRSPSKATASATPTASSATAPQSKETSSTGGQFSP
jgi:DNA-directed RNA polymerase specialized sigma24 family protein